MEKLKITPKMRDRFWSKVRKTGKCLTWTGARDRNGYGNFYVGTLDGKRKYMKPHIFAYHERKGEIPRGMVHRHTCHNDLCCNYKHIVPGTQSENMLDKRNNPHPAKPPKRLTPLERRGVVALRKEGFPIPTVATMFGVSARTVQLIFQKYKAATQ